MTALRCDVCNRWMELRWFSTPFRASWRCPNEGFLKHVEKELAAR